MDIELHPLEGTARPLGQWLTTFPLATVVLDPYTHESSWILDTALRVLAGFRGADVRVSFVVTGTDPEGALRFLGPLADEILAGDGQVRTGARVTRALREAGLELGLVDGPTFDRLVRPENMV